MRINYKRYLLYLLRWQLSTPILAVVLVWLAWMNQWTATVIANLIGGLIFFWVDQFIFRSRMLDALWEVKEGVVCADCGMSLARGYRLVQAGSYDRSRDNNPEFRCEPCSQKKVEELREHGVSV